MTFLKSITFAALAAAPLLAAPAMAQTMEHRVTPNGVTKPVGEGIYATQSTTTRASDPTQVPVTPGQQGPSKTTNAGSGEGGAGGSGK